MLLVVLTKTLGAEEYGWWVQVNVAVGLLMPIAVLGFDKALLRLLPEVRRRSEASRLFTGSIVFVLLGTTVCAALVALLSPWISQAFFKGAERASLLVLALGLQVICEGVIQHALVFFRGRFCAGWYASLALGRELGWVGIVFLLATSGTTLLVIVFAYVAWLGLIALVSLCGVWRTTGWKKPSFARMPEMARFGLPLVAAHPLSWLAKFGSIFLISLLGSSFEAGVYAVGSTIATGILTVVTVLLLALVPTFTRLYCDGQREKLRATMQSTLNYFLLISALGAVLGGVFGRPFLELMTTERVAEAGGKVLIIQVIAAVVLGAYSIVSTTVLLTRQTSLYVVYWAVIGSFLLVANVILIPQFGVLGAVSGELAAYVIGFTLAFRTARCIVAIRVDVGFLLRIGAAAVLAGAAGVLAKSTSLGLLLSAAVCATTYIAGAFCVGLLPIEWCRRVVAQLREGSGSRSVR